jgi:hypothetical protein
MKDEIYKQKEKQLLSTISYIKAVDETNDKSKAYEIIELAAKKFMVEHYFSVFEGIDESNKFFHFCNYYKEYPKISPYCNIISVSDNELIVEFERCPLHEMLTNNNLDYYTSAYCKSDKVFTDIHMPNVKFSRSVCIAEGGKSCIMKWRKEK